MQASILREQGLEHFRAGRFDEADRLLKTALAQSPGDGHCLHWLGVLAHQRGDADLAVQQMSAASAALPADARILCNLAEACRAAGRTEQAEAASRRALELRPEYPEASLNLTAALSQQRRFIEAEASARATLALRPDLIEAGLFLAEALREQGQIAAAEVAYLDILETAPEDWRVLTNLGLILVQAGRMDEGLSHCRRAAEASTHSVLPIENLGRVLLDYGQIDEAMDRLEDAIERAPNSASLSLAIGIAWAEQGEYGDARDWFERVIFLDPSLLEAKVRIAALECEMDNPLEALEILNSVLEIEAGRADALLGRSRAHLLLGNVAEAIADSRAAIDLHPEAAHLRAALGNLLSTSGDIDGAIDAHRQALSLSKNNITALSGLLTTLKHRALPQERDQALALLDAPWMTEQKRSALHFGLAAYHDGAGEWETAAAHMSHANAHRKNADLARNRTYDPAAYEAYVDRLISTFTPELFAQMKGMGSMSERPVFIVGMPRSGTTLTEQILASHPDCYGAGERPYAAHALQLLPHVQGRPTTDSLTCLTSANAAQLRACAEWHLEQLAALDGGATRHVVDKMPDNANLLGWLAILFPKARFIYCQRDLRDVALSCWVTNFAEIRWANDMDHLAHRIQQHQRLMAHWQEVLPVNLYVSDYESLVSDQQTQSRKLISSLDLEWDDACLSFFKTERPVRTASVSQVRQPIYKASVARWTRYASQLSPVVNALKQSFLK